MLFNYPNRIKEKHTIPAFFKNYKQVHTLQRIGIDLQIHGPGGSGKGTHILNL